jgi:hypothetical protein
MNSHSIRKKLSFLQNLRRIIPTCIVRDFGALLIEAYPKTKTNGRYVSSTIFIYLIR